MRLRFRFCLGLLLFTCYEPLWKRISYTHPRVRLRGFYSFTIIACFNHTTLYEAKSIIGFLLCKAKINRKEIFPVPFGKPQLFWVHSFGILFCIIWWVFNLFNLYCGTSILLEFCQKFVYRSQRALYLY